MKRIFDITLAGLGIVVSSPLWALIALSIILEDGYPVIIRQKRIGKMGRFFAGYKFRSMKTYTLREKVNVQAREHDPRITRVGAILRRCAMDELPQLVNILLGDMSFVGPRALLPAECEVHGFTNGGAPDISTIPGYARRITMTPGLTGIAQIFAPRDILRRHKFKYDLLYVRKHSLWLDCRLIIISFLVTLQSSWEKRGAKLNILKTRRFVPGDTGLRSWRHDAMRPETPMGLKERLSGVMRKGKIFDYIKTWAPLAIFLILIFPLFNLYDRAIYIRDHFKIFGDTIRVFFPETPLYVLTTLWAVVRDLSHVIAYGFLTFLLFRGFTNREHDVRFNHFLYTGALLLSFCMLDEFIQALMPSRGFEIMDIVLNVLAVVAVLLFMHRRYYVTPRTAPAIALPSRASTIIRAWTPPAVYVVVLVILANVIFTNDNTVYVIDRFVAVVKPQVAYGTLCMWVGKTRDYSHIFIYAAFAALVFNACRKTWRWSFLRLCVMTAVIGVLFGISDEFAQSLLMGRSASMTDWFIDVIGVGIWMISLALHRILHDKFDTRSQ